MASVAAAALPPPASPPSTTTAPPVPSDSSPSPPLGSQLTTPSNPSREPPTPDEPPPTLPSSVTLTTSPPSLSPPTSKHRIPPFPPPHPSRVSPMSSLSANGEPFHPQFASSLPYTSVRDFAYPALHPLHYGPSVPSGLSTPAGSQRSSRYFENPNQAGSWFTEAPSGYRRLSDPAHPSYDFGVSTGSTNVGWGDPSTSRQRSSNQPPPLNFSDGPPWSEDEDLQSPVVVSKHRKHKSSAPHLQSTGSQHHSRHSKIAMTPTTLEHFAGNRHGGGRDVEDDDWGNGRRDFLENGLSPGGDYYTGRSGRRTDLAGGEPGGELYNHPEDEEYSPHDQEYYPNQPFSDEEVLEHDDGGDEIEDEDSRFSRDYQFTIASPDEEMHGKAVALFDFTRENENELPLVEGQVVWVSYRIGVGWLVAEDPKTGESGLVPEEYVRLLRDLRPLYNSRESEAIDDTPLLISVSPASENQPRTPNSQSNNGLNPPIISTFSTSSQDVHPYPYQFHYPTDHPPSHPAHMRAKSSPELGLDSPGAETPTAGNRKERIADLLFEQERAVQKEMEDTQRLPTSQLDSTTSAEKPAEALTETPTVPRPGNSDRVGVKTANRTEEVFYDAMERQGEKHRDRAALDFRDKAR